ncbi:hypothetical protein A7X67_12010 [Clostridium sp. W14A]|nr:hypothetical protein A7X67_12010 [Clostridium sp. W14A]
METAIYVRVSTEEQAQEGFSIRAQEQKLKDYVRIKDWSIYKIYADEGISGKDITGRPAVKEMIADVKSGLVKNVLVFKIDRLTRSTADLIYLVDLFNANDCEFNSLMESIDTQTASGRMFIKIIGIFAEFERENIIERTRVGVERKVKEGYSLCTSSASFGYDRVKGQKMQTVNPAEAEVVRDVFEMFVNNGLTLTDIARRLNLRGILTKKDKTWSSVKVRRVLTNCNYVGDVRHHINDSKHKQEYDGLHEAIIPQELFDAAKDILEQNKKVGITKPPNDEKYFAGFLECAKCGYKMKTYESRKQLKTKIQITVGYVCCNHTLGTCTVGSMSHKKVEAAFEEYISQIADFNDADNPSLAEEKKIKHDNSEAIQSLEAKLKGLETRERETLERYVRNEIDFDDYREMKKLVASDKLVLSAELERLSAAPNPTAVKPIKIARNFRENWDKLSNHERRAFLKQFVERIVIESVKPKGEFFGQVKIREVRWRM